MNEKDLVAVKALVREITPGARILEANHGCVPLDLIMGSGIHAANVRPWEPFRSHAHHPFATWHWTTDRPLSLPKLRSAIEKLPESIYRVKGIVYLEEMPSHQVVLQMVGKRYNIGDTDPWGPLTPQSEIVMIASHAGIDSEALQRAFDGCIGNGDESQSPILRLTRLLATDTQGGH